MHSRLSAYKQLLVSDISQLAKCLDPRLASNIVDEAAFLRSMISLLIELYSTASPNKRFSNGGQYINALMINILEEKLALQSEKKSDKIVKLIHATSAGSLNVDTWHWSFLNCSRCPNLTSAAQDVLAVQGSSVANESCSSRVDNISSTKRAFVMDISFIFTLFLGGW